MSDEHKARRWVEEKFPLTAPRTQALLILAYGAGLDAGLAEAQQVIADALAHAGTPEGRQL
jgi:hypothetical protein